MAISLRILFDQLRWQIIVWNVVLSLFAAFYFYYGYFEGLKDIAWGVWVIGFVFSQMVVKTMFTSSRHLSVLKANVKNLKYLWCSIFFQNMVLISVDFLVLAFLLYMFRVDPFSYISLWEYISIIVAVLIVMCGSDGTSYSENYRRNVYGKGWILSLTVLVFLAIGYLSMAIHQEVSPLVAYYVVSVVLSGFFAFGTDEIEKTFSKKLKYKMFAMAMIAFTVMQGVFGVLDYKYSKGSQYVIAPKYTWSFQGLESVKSVEDWVEWQNNLKTLDDMSVEQIIASYDRLQMLCSPKARDTILVVRCPGELRMQDYQYTGFKRRSEEEVLKLLSAPTEYAQMMGLLYARKLEKPLSRDMITAIEYVAEKESHIQLLAKNTLTESYPEDYRAGFTVEVIPQLPPEEP